MDSEQTIASESSENSTDQDDSAMEMELASFGEPYEDEPLASDDGKDEGREETDADGLTSAILEARFEREMTVRE